jgi:hypothetical protein
MDATLETLRLGKATDKAAKHFRETRDDFEQQVRKFAGMGVSTRRRRVRSDVGDNVNVDKWLSGDFNCWDTTRRDARRLKVNLGIGGSLSCGNDESEFAKICATAAAAADLLSLLGYSVEINYAAMFHTGGDFKLLSEHKIEQLMILAPLKREGETLDVQRLLACAAPGLLRAVGFSEWEYDLGAHSSYGYPRECHEVRYVSGIDHLIARLWVSLPDGTQYKQGDLFQSIISKQG